MWSFVGDFSRRWWLAFPALAVVAMMSGAAPFFLVWLVLAGPLALSWDAMRGALKAHGTLPVTKKTLGHAMWFEAVVLFPLVCAPIVGLAQVYGAFVSPATVEGFAETAFLYVVGMGLASFLFLLLLIQPNALEGGLGAGVKGGVFGGLWGLSFGSSMFLAVRAKDLAWTPYGDLVLVVALALIVTGFLSATRFAREKVGARATVATGAASRRAAARIRMPGRWAGFVAPWLREAGFTLMLYVLFVLFFSLFQLVASGREAAAHIADNSIPIIFPLVMAASARLLTWLASARSLRALPLSRLQLALLYLALPCILFGVALACWHVTCILVGNAGNALQMLTFLLPLLGAFFLSSTLYLRTGSFPVFILLLIGISFATSFRFFDTMGSASTLIPAALTGLVLLLVGFVYLYRLLGNSSSAYRPKQLVAGQAMGGR
ncbi:MAG TPA: hypothetical protein PLO37_26350 [Candidatus Hydrogenedentes bacterium]|nr:hypothetical protein [Candidatus Hydrogenedentota bacterium]HPG70377.1 hypothetical protein [Candidatus Hydrogenedentota bacterium]